ncbi:hypothetical protein LOK49_LG02G00283 [Camellia lanceoleosa]|uniref:Uncharacterized protein n=1 Tax=Camellia lanceoleosa TaxID=1840588 RepID=A0ACC0IJN5_9ERIC|nr:hypothetical protein LOK49_LG02G00283 [Camellia lanceoleosa]
MAVKMSIINQPQTITPVSCTHIERENARIREIEHDLEGGHRRGDSLPKSRLWREPVSLGFHLRGLRHSRHSTSPHYRRLLHHHPLPPVTNLLKGTSSLFLFLPLICKA